MNAVRVAVRKLYGLFVDDLGYALAIAAWIVISLAVVRLLDPGLRGIVLFAGFALILIASVVRSARGTHRAP
jgi:hypothetical protein